MLVLLSDLVGAHGVGSCFHLKNARVENIHDDIHSPVFARRRLYTTYVTLYVEHPTLFFLYSY